ncbi:hypothetical protein GOP47_0029378 [Adiantum capillus-veneris]|nr:hypothetical protein GOP47_0029378 [Adiantum capillus-veneris]
MDWLQRSAQARRTFPVSATKACEHLKAGVGAPFPCDNCCSLPSLQLKAHGNLGNSSGGFGLPKTALLRFLGWYGYTSLVSSHRGWDPPFESNHTNSRIYTTPCKACERKAGHLTEVLNENIYGKQVLH